MQPNVDSAPSYCSLLASEDWISMGRLPYALRLASLKEKAKKERNKNIHITPS